jgi:hypothetical protein
LPGRWNRAAFLLQVLRRSLAVVGEDAVAVGKESSPAIRVSLGAARNRAELAQALQFLKDTLRSSVQTVQIVQRAAHERSINGATKAGEYASVPIPKFACARDTL